MHQYFKFKMTKFVCFLSTLGILLMWQNSQAQIYSQGKNLNRQNTFFVDVELKEKPLDASKFLAKVNFYGKRKDIDFYLKDGVEHKSFDDELDLIKYMEDNGWFFLKDEVLKARSNSRTKSKYFFRKSMSVLKEEHEESSMLSNPIKP